MNRHFAIPKSSMYDLKKTGFYSKKNNDLLNLRIQDSNIELEGIVRFKKYGDLTNNNNNNGVFEGFDGEKWVQFNALKGEKGDRGEDFNNKFRFKNTDGDGQIFKTTELDTNKSTEVEVRSLKSANYILNNGESVFETMSINTEGDNILLESKPIPFSWDISNMSINNMKSTNSDKYFKCFGKSVFVSFEDNTTIERGRFVSLFTNKNGSIVVKPFEYEGNLNLFMNPVSVYGVALEDTKDKKDGKIRVCIEGVTTVQYCLDHSLIDDNLMGLNYVEKCNSIGLLSKNGTVFCSPIKPVTDYIKVGYFIEKREFNDDDNLVLFNVKI